MEKPTKEKYTFEQRFALDRASGHSWYITPSKLRWVLGGDKFDGGVETFSAFPLLLVEIHHPTNGTKFYSTIMQEFGFWTIPDQFFENLERIEDLTFIFDLHQKKYGKESKDYEKHLSHTYNFVCSPSNYDIWVNGVNCTISLRSGSDTVVLHIIEKSLVCVFVVPRLVDYQDVIGLTLDVFGTAAYLVQVQEGLDNESSTLRTRSDSVDSSSSNTSLHNLSFGSSMEIPTEVDEDTYVPPSMMLTNKETEEEQIIGALLLEVTRAINAQRKLRLKIEEKFQLSFGGNKTYQQLDRLWKTDQNTFYKLLAFVQQNQNSKIDITLPSNHPKIYQIVITNVKNLNLNSNTSQVNIESLYS